MRGCWNDARLRENNSYPGEESNKFTVVITQSVLARDSSGAFSGRNELWRENMQQLSEMFTFQSRDYNFLGNHVLGFVLICNISVIAGFSTSVNTFLMCLWSQSIFSSLSSKYGHFWTKIATAKMSNWRLQSCSPQTNGWRHGDYVHLFIQFMVGEAGLSNWCSRMLQYLIEYWCLKALHSNLEIKQHASMGMSAKDIACLVVVCST